MALLTHHIQVRVKLEWDKRGDAANKSRGMSRQHHLERLNILTFPSIALRYLHQTFVLRPRNELFTLEDVIYPVHCVPCSVPFPRKR